MRDANLNRFMRETILFMRDAIFRVLTLSVHHKIKPIREGLDGGLLIRE